MASPADDKERPMISITGPSKIVCGNTAKFIAVTKPENLEGWSVEWRKHLKCTQTRINSNTTKYCGSTEKNLVLQSVCKEDEGGYQAFLSKVSKANTELYVPSNIIFLQAIGELPIFDVWVVTTELKKIRIHYAIKKGPPRGKEIELFKDGVRIWYRNMLLNGGNLDGNHSTISSESSTINHRGNYSCVVTNAVGSVQKDFRIDFPNAEISTEQQPYIGSKTMFTSRIVSCPSPDGAEWQQSNDGKTFESITISKPKYYGSSCEPKSPLLIIPNVTFEDKLYYRLLVWNTIGEQYSNTVFLDVKGDETSERTPTEKELASVSKHIGADFYILGVLLGLTTATIDQIIGTYRHSTQTQILKILLFWKNKNGSQATIGKLLQAVKSHSNAVNILDIERIFQCDKNDDFKNH